MLTDGLEVHNAGVILAEKEQRFKGAPLDAYLDVLLRANPEVFLEALNMATRARKRTFEEVFTEAGLIPKWIAQGVE